MHQHCTELLDMFRDPAIILRFHALPTKPESVVSPWRLQVSLRADRPWELLQALCQSSVWTLMATSLKQHSRFQSPLALKLEESLGLKTMKGTGKGSKRPQGLQGPIQVADHQEGIVLSLNRNDMMSTLTQLRLQNHSNWCFANSVFQTFIWCLLSLSHFQVDMWGMHRDSILRFLARAKGSSGQFGRRIICCRCVAMLGTFGSCQFFMDPSTSMMQLNMSNIGFSFCNQRSLTCVGRNEFLRQMAL